MSIYSKITLHDVRGRWRVKIDHAGKKAVSARFENAADAYADAESKLIYKPGYVQSVPREARWARNV